MRGPLGQILPERLQRDHGPADILIWDRQPPDSESGRLDEAAHRWHFAATALGPSAGNSGAAATSLLSRPLCSEIFSIQSTNWPI